MMRIVFRLKEKRREMGKRVKKAASGTLEASRKRRAQSDSEGSEDVIGEEGSAILKEALRARQESKKLRKRRKQAVAEAGNGVQSEQGMSNIVPKDEDDDVDSEEEALRKIRRDKTEEEGEVVESENEKEMKKLQEVAVVERMDDFRLNLPFGETLAVVSDAFVEIENSEDDLQREVEFYNQALANVKQARNLLDEENTPHMRPLDYFAEMVKSDDHMARVKQNLLFEKKKIEAFEQRKQQKEYKKYAKKMQAEKIKEKSALKKRKDEVAKEFKEKSNNEMPILSKKPKLQVKSRNSEGNQKPKSVKRNRLGKSRRHRG